MKKIIGFGLGLALGLAILLVAHFAHAQTVGFPEGGFPIANSAGGTTSSVVATLAPPDSSEVVFICGFEFTFLENSTGATTSGPVAVNGLIDSSAMVVQVGNVAASTAYTYQQTFTPCIPASGPGQSITVTTTANAQASSVDVTAWGYWH